MSANTKWRTFYISTFCVVTMPCCTSLFLYVSADELQDLPILQPLNKDIDEKVTYEIRTTVDTKPYTDQFADIPIFNRGIPDEQRLMNFLFRGYERTVRPVRNASTPVIIRIGITLTQIFDMVSKIVVHCRCNE